MTVLKSESSTYLESISHEYAMYVLSNRAIPSMTDGLKLSQRIALYLIQNKASEVKTISLAGEMISSKLYVHGDKSAADTISFLAAPYLNNIPLIQGEGQFGTRVAPVDGIGAPRYTDVKRSKFAEQHLYLDLDILPMVENYDGSKHMPATFLPLLPLVLLNGVKGIATGWSTLILPRRLSDLKKAVQEVLKHGKVKTKLLPHFEKFDVGIFQDHRNKNRYTVRGKLNIKNTSTVEITELPPDLSLDSFKEHLIKLEEEGRIKDFTDNTTDRINIEVKMSRSALANQTEDSLIELFKIRSYYTENIVVLAPDGSGVRRYDDVNDLVVDFVNWRLGWYLTRYEHKLRQEEEKCLFWRTFVACFPDVSKKIAGFQSKNHLMKAVWGAAQKQKIETRQDIVDRIVSLPVYRWTEEGRDEAIKALKESEGLMKEYRAIIASEDDRTKIYMEEVAS